MPYDYEEAAGDLTEIATVGNQAAVRRVLDFIAEVRESELAKDELISTLKSRLRQRVGGGSSKAPTAHELRGLSIHVDNATCHRLGANCLVMDEATYAVIKKHITVEAATTDDV